MNEKIYLYIKQNETATTQEVQMKSWTSLEMQIAQCIIILFLLQQMDIIDKI